jgi:hypothetical protein
MSENVREDDSADGDSKCARETYMSSTKIRPFQTTSRGIEGVHRHVRADKEDPLSHHWRILDLFTSLDIRRSELIDTYRFIQLSAPDQRASGEVNGIESTIQGTDVDDIILNPRLAIFNRHTKIKRV